MTSTLSIRPSSNSDRGALEALYAKSFGRLLADDYPDALMSRALLHLSRIQGPLDIGTYYVAEDPRGRMIGAGGWTRKRPGTGEIAPGLAHLRHFAVDPDSTRSGIGRAIFDACLNDAGSETTFECYATRTAVPFYAALGFRPIGDIDIPMEADLAFPSIRMIRKPEGDKA